MPDITIIILLVLEMPINPVKHENEMAGINLEN